MISLKSGWISEFELLYNIHFAIISQVQHGFQCCMPIFFLRIAKQPGQLVMYHLCFCKVIYMWCTSYSWEKKLTLVSSTKISPLSTCQHALPRPTECNQSIWQGHERNNVSESRNLSQYTSAGGCAPMLGHPNIWEIQVRSEWWIYNALQCSKKNF